MTTLVYRVSVAVEDVPHDDESVPMVSIDVVKNIVRLALEQATRRRLHDFEVKATIRVEHTGVAS
ncbi:MAG: hypothetical protein K0S99_139 [Thermomicrobiales bacterium]|nr:hypothetical protein [Thermomicrobiales bacterium]